MNLPADDDPALTPADPWTALRVHTPARIAIGRSGASLPTRELLAFGIAHAQARDAVHAALDVAALRADLAGFGLPIVDVRSAAPNRAAYLARPDWGRRLDASSLASLPTCATTPDVLFVIADGLSAVAAQRHAAPLLAATLPQLSGLAIGPLVIATQARVALADSVAIALGARLVVSLIGERPGLSAPDSLGAYVTFKPTPATTDAERNCLSNIRPQGLGHDEAAGQLAGLIRASLVEAISGVSLRVDDAAKPLAIR